jgi:hypothetical protein
MRKGTLNSIALHYANILDLEPRCLRRTSGALKLSLRRSRYELNLVYFEGYCVVSVIRQHWKMRSWAKSAVRRFIVKLQGVHQRSDWQLARLGWYQ